MPRNCAKADGGEGLGENSGLRVEIVADGRELARRCMGRFIDEAGTAVKKRGVFYAAISGGRTARGVFELLGKEGAAEFKQWDRVHLFWADERYVPADSELSNYRLAADTFLDRVGIPAENIHRVGTGLDDIGQAAKVYERTIRRVFGVGEGQIPVFDLVILGMGADGHTASILPGDVRTLQSQKLVCAVRKAGEAFGRITLTPKVLRAARHIVVLVSGQEKAKTLGAVLSGEGDEVKFPIRTLWTVIEKVEWLVDREATC